MQAMSPMKKGKCLFVIKFNFHEKYTWNIERNILNLFKGLLRGKKSFF